MSSLDLDRFVGAADVDGAANAVGAISVRDEDEAVDAATSNGTVQDEPVRFRAPKTMEKNSSGSMLRSMLGSQFSLSGQWQAMIDDAQVRVVSALYVVSMLCSPGRS